DGNGQIEATTFFRQVGGGKIDCDAAGGKLESRVRDRRAYAITAFLHDGFGKPHDREGGQTAADVGFDCDDRCIHAVLSTAQYRCHGHSVALLLFWAVGFRLGARSASKPHAQEPEFTSRACTRIVHTAAASP